MRLSNFCVCLFITYYMSDQNTIIFINAIQFPQKAKMKKWLYKLRFIVKIIFSFNKNLSNFTYLFYSLIMFVCLSCYG